MAAAKDRHTLTSYYAKLYKQKYGEEAVINRYTAQWGWDSILGDMSLAKVKELLDYYFANVSVRQHDIDWFFYNYDKILVNRKDQEKDARLRAKLMEESKERAERWRNKRLGNQGTTDD
jgi:hypothetical protein